MQTQPVLGFRLNLKIYATTRGAHYYAVFGNFHLNVIPMSFEKLLQSIVDLARKNVGNQI